MVRCDRGRGQRDCRFESGGIAALNRPANRFDPFGMGVDGWAATDWEWAWGGVEGVDGLDGVGSFAGDFAVFGPNG